MTCGSISPSANSRTDLRRCFCSSENVKSTVASPHTTANRHRNVTLYRDLELSSKRVLPSLFPYRWLALASRRAFFRARPHDREITALLLNGKLYLKLLEQRSENPKK